MRPWTEQLDLTEFYNTAQARGFENNASQKRLVDNFQTEQDFQTWILYYNNQAVGSVAAHTLDFWPNSYRICARTCVFTDLLPLKQLRGLTRTIKHHQNVTAQFYIPKCIEWAGKDNNLYITSHDGGIGTQKLVHDIYCPALVETGVLTHETELYYRGHLQSFWRLNTDEFLRQLDLYGHWQQHDEI